MKLFQIDTFEEVQAVSKHNVILPESVYRFLADFFGQLRLSLGPESESFRLSDHSYTLFLLKPGNHLSADQLESMSDKVEYTERIDLGDCQLFKVCLMEDNDSFTFLFAISGTQAKDVEKWLDSLIVGGDQS